MKKLREGVSTGSCMTGGAEASVIWQTTGKCPSVVKVDTPIGKTLYLDIIPRLSCLRKKETFSFSEEKESALSRRKD